MTAPSPSKKLVSTLAFCWIAAASSGVRAEGTDELWEITTQMNLNGMSMPIPAVQQCIAKGGSYQPEARGKSDCQITDLKTSGGTVSWKMQCTGKEPMTGSGEMTRTADAMNGSFHVVTAHGEMNQTLAGRRVGACDAAAARQKRDAQVESVRSQGQAAMQQACDGQIQQLAATAGNAGDPQGRLFHGDGMCASFQPKLCSAALAAAATYEGFPAYLAGGPLVAECKIDVEKQRATLCPKAVGDQNWNFVGAQCPEERARVNAKDCSGFGLDYTADMARPNAAKCRALRGSPPAAAQAPAAPPVPAEKPKDNSTAGQVMDAAKKLKGILGF